MVNINASDTLIQSLFGKVGIAHAIKNARPAKALKWMTLSELGISGIGTAGR